MKKMWDESNQLSKRAVPYQNGDRQTDDKFTKTLSKQLFDYWLTLSNDVKRKEIGFRRRACFD